MTWVAAPWILRCIRLNDREDCPDVLKVDEIATNRYTLLGGDDFDRAIADVMFEHYQKQYSTSPMVVRKLQQEKKAIMPQLLNYAEELKLELANAVRQKAAMLPMTALAGMMRRMPKNFS